MSDLINEIYHTSLFMLPGVTLLIGLSGSIHCAGMCGGLVISVCGDKKQMALYQVGRLISYICLGVIAASLGHFLSIGPDNIIVSLLPALAIGSMLVIMGLKNMSGKRPEFPLPLWMKISLSKVWSRLVPKQHKLGGIGPFLTGSLSIFLPCGLLYAVVLALASFKSPMMAALGMSCFWLGGVPSLVFGPQLLRKFLSPIAQKLPVLSSLSLVCVGLITISYRILSVYQEHQHCH